VVLTGIFFPVVCIFLIARIPWVERGVGRDRLMTWHRKLGPWNLCLIGGHVLFIVLSSADQDGDILVVELRRMLSTMSWMWTALAGFKLMVMAGVLIVSGLPQVEDHLLGVEIITEYLGRRGEQQ